MATVATDHAARGGEGSSGRIINLRFLQGSADSEVTEAPTDQYSAVGEQGGRMRRAGRGHAAGGSERASGRIVEFGGGKYETAKRDFPSASGQQDLAVG